MTEIETLQSMSAKLAAEHMEIYEQDVLLDRELELLACHFTGQHLLNFINTKMGLWMIMSDMFTQSGFQNLLLQVLRELDNSQVKKSLRTMVDDFTIHMRATPALMNDAVLQLRLFRWHQRQFYSHTLEYFMEDMNASLSHRIYPKLTVRPYLPIPKSQTIYEHRMLSEFEAWQLEKQKYPFCLNWEDTVFTFLRAMAESSRYARWHKVLAFGFHLLSHPDLFNGRTRWYKLDIFGKTAVALANLQVDSNLVFFLLEQLPEVQRFASCKFHTWLVYQKVYSAYGLVKQEKDTFQKMFTVVPHQSLFWVEACKTHFDTKIKQVENLLAIVMTKRKFYKDTSKNELVLCDTLIDKIYKKLNSLEKFCFRILSVVTYPTFVVDIENEMLATVRLYNVALTNLFTTWSNRDKVLRRISQQMSQRITPARCCLDLIDKQISLENYEANVQMNVNYIKVKSQTLYSVSAGEFYMTQCILLASFRMHPFVVSRYLGEAKLQLSKATDGRHRRLGLIQAWMSVRNGGINFDTHNDFVINESLYRSASFPSRDFAPFSVERVLRSDPEVATLLRFGIDACEKFAPLTY